MPMNFIQNEGDWFKNTIRVFSDSRPTFLSRIGGSDTEAVVAHHRAEITGVPQSVESIKRYKDLVCRYNGYYDPSSSNELYNQYCDLLLKCYFDAEHILFCNFQLLSMYFSKWIHPQFYRQDFENKADYEMLIKSMDASSANIECYAYPFVERVVCDEWTLFRAFSKILPGKTVLVVSPFAESINANFHNKQRFFPNYAYPEFRLVTYNTPITYSGLAPELYPDANWHYSLDRMKNEIKEIDFDIALLSCGSYALPLGEFIAKEHGKHAIYVGGVLQIYFGIMGRRYDNPFFLDQINRKSFITPIESKKFMRFATIDVNTAKEALGAYF